MLDLPRFAVLHFEHAAASDDGWWHTFSMHSTYAEALEAFQRQKGNGYERLYLAGLAFVRAPADRVDETTEDAP